MQKIDQACVNTLRFLAADQVEKAKSGHPGFPLGTAALSLLPGLAAAGLTQDRQHETGSP